MPNPSRPQFRGVIDETWGQLVADRVVRRYASAAERDADLAGLPDLEGQLVAMVPGGGVAPFLVVRSRGAWVQAAPDMQIGFAQQSTDVNGFITVAFPRAWGPGSSPIVLAMPLQGPGGLVWDLWASTNSYFSIRARNGLGTVFANTPISFFWLASEWSMPSPVAAELRALMEAAANDPDGPKDLPG